MSSADAVNPKGLLRVSGWAANWIITSVVCLVVLRPHPETGNPWIDVFLGDIVLVPIIGGLWMMQIYAGKLCGLPLAPVALACWLIFIILFQSGQIDAQRAITLVYLVAALQSLLWLSMNQSPATPHLRRRLHIALAICLAIAVTQALSINPLGMIGTICGEVKLRPIESGSNFRVYGTYYNANWAGCAACCWVSLIWLEIITNPSRTLRWLLLLLAPLLFLLMTGSRSAMFAVCPMLVMGFVWTLLSFPRAAVYAIALCAAVGLLVFQIDMSWLWDQDFASRWVTIAQPMEQYSFLARVDLWNSALNIWLSAPFVGVGRLSEDDLPHNAFLSVLCAVGLLGAIAFVAAVLAVVGPFLQRRGFRIWWLGTACTLSIMFATGDLIWSTQVSLTVVLLLCAGASAPPIRRQGSLFISKG